MNSKQIIKDIAGAHNGFNRGIVIAGAIASFLFVKSRILAFKLMRQREIRIKPKGYYTSRLIRG